MKMKRTRGSHRHRSSSKPNHTLHRQPLGSRLRLNGFEHLEPRLLLSGETLLGDSVAELDSYQYENDRIASVIGANEVSMLTSASAAASTHTFRVDSGWELDSYQFRDNPIHFYINVHDIDVSAIESATMTMAVWDVDYNGPYPPERDEVYLNNHRLTTPQAYLTGADSQWSTVTFNVDPAWIVDGSNRVDIIIDVLPHAGLRWAVECDWAELAVEVGDTPEIEDIQISANPTTTEDVTFTAQLTNMTGYEVVKIAWAGDVQAGEGDPSYTVQLARGTHGKDKNITATLTYRNVATGETGTADPFSETFDSFFKKTGDDDNDGTDNWYEYWSSSEDSAAGYDASSSTYTYRGGAYSGGGSIAQYNGSVANPRYSLWNRATMSVSHGGITYQGIDTVEFALAHERTHRIVDQRQQPGGIWDDTVHADSDGDELPDFWETAHAAEGYDPNNANSFPGFIFGDDEEYYCNDQAAGSSGVTANDWANPGKQTTPSYLRIVSETGTQAFLTGAYSDRLVDADGDGSIDTLAVDAEITVQSAGSYRMFANLYDSTGQMLWDEVFAEYTVGNHLVTLSFDGNALRQRRVDGPYNLGSIILFGQNLEEEHDDVHLTEPYQYTDFGPFGSEIVGNFVETTLDTDGNGLVDALGIDVIVNIAQEEDIVLEAYLLAPDGSPITYAIAGQHLSAGQHAVTLTFDGAAIRRSRADGPYIIESLALFEGGERSDFLFEAYHTLGHSYSDFEGQNAEFSPSAAFGDYGIDLDANGLFDLLRVETIVDVAEEGQYLAAGRLFDAGGEWISDATTEVTLGAGQQTVALDFSGLDIALHRELGPYELRYTYLYDSTGTLADSLPAPYATSAYNYTEFQGLPVALTGNYTDFGTDTNNDGIFDYLTVDVEVIVQNAGSYAMNARLLDQAENEIIWASTTSWLPADQPQTMRLNFSGQSIFDHGAAGPYYVRDVYVYNTGNPGLSDSVYEAYTTAAYALSDFGILPLLADAGGPYLADEGTEIVLDASGSTNSGGGPLEYRWDFDSDGEWDTPWSTDPIAAYVWGDDWTGMATLEVTDGNTSSTDTASVTVNNVAPSLTLDTAAALTLGDGEAFLGRVGVEQSHDASATDPGSDALTFEWNFTVATISNSYFVDPILDPDGLDPVGSQNVAPRDVSDTAGVTFTEPGVYTITVTVRDDDGGSDSVEFTKLVTNDMQEARSQGFWQHQFAGGKQQHIQDAALLAYLDIVDFASRVFGEEVPLGSLAEASDVFQPGGLDVGDPHLSNMKGKATQQALAAWLNFASGEILWDQLVPTGQASDPEDPFSLAIMGIEDLLLDLDGDDDHEDYVLANDIATAINEMDE